MSTKPPIDLSAIATSGSKVSVSVEPDENEVDRSHRLGMEKIRFWVGQAWLFLGVAALAAICALVLLPLISSPDAKIGEWARAGFYSIITGILGFIGGKATSK